MYVSQKGAPINYFETLIIDITDERYCVFFILLIDQSQKKSYILVDNQILFLLILISALSSNTEMAAAIFTEFLLLTFFFYIRTTMVKTEIVAIKSSLIAVYFRCYVSRISLIQMTPINIFVRQ